MTDDEPHPVTVFLHETSEGKVAFSPSTEKDTGRHWLFNWENSGFNFNFVVHDRDGVLGYEIYAKDSNWIGRFLYNREIEYVEEPCEEVRELVSDSVEIRDLPDTTVSFKKRCSNCDAVFIGDVRPKIELMIEGEPRQQVFEETCPTCGEKLVEKKTHGV